MNFRLTAILFTTILVLIVVLLAFTYIDEGTEAPTGLLLTDLATVKADQIDRVEVEKEDGSKLTFSKLDKDKWEEEWEVSGAGGKIPIKAKADSAAVMQVISGLLKAKPVQYSGLKSNLSILGLQPPTLKVTLRQGNERSASVSFGDVDYGGAEGGIVYVIIPSKANRPLAIDRSSVDPLLRTQSGLRKSGDLVKWGDDFRVKTFFGADARAGGNDVDGLTLTAKGKTLSIARVGGVWKFVAPAGWGDVDPFGEPIATPGTFTSANALVSTITSLQALGATDFVDNPSPDDLLVKYGVTEQNPDRVKVEVKTIDKGTTTVYIGKKDIVPLPPAVGGMPPAGKVWVKVEGEPGVIRANCGDLSGLIPVIENPDPLRDRNLLGNINKDRIDGLNITAGGQTTLLRRSGGVGEWKLFGNPSAGDPQAASNLAVQNILDVLLEHRTIKSFPPVNPANFAPPEIKAEIKLWVDGFEPNTDPKADLKAEPKEKNKPTVLLLGKKEADSIYVRRTLPDGTTADFLVPDKIKLTAANATLDLVPTVAKTRIELLDPNLKTFSSEIANKITVTGVKNYELDKSEKKDPSTNKDKWTFAAPADQKGKTADAGTIEDMLRYLGTTHSVARFVDESPTPAKLIEYGFAPMMPPPPMPTPAPRLKVVIGLKGTDALDKERVFEFGAISGDYVYARQPGKAAVFTLPKLVYDKFADADLRDREIFHFDVAQINAVELKGWGAAGFQIKLSFEKKDGTWKALEPAGFMVDPRKVENFLGTLSTTSVKSFQAGMPTPQQGAGDIKVSLDITLKSASGPPITITLAAPTDNNSSYFGWTSLLPAASPVFTVDASRFKEYKESSGSFAK
jgi:hypothetical protein